MLKVMCTPERDPVPALGAAVGVWFRKHDLPHEIAVWEDVEGQAPGVPWAHCPCSVSSPLLCVDATFNYDAQGQVAKSTTSTISHLPHWLKIPLLHGNGRLNRGMQSS